MLVNNVIRCLTNWHKRKDSIVAWWFTKEDVEDVIGKPLTADQWSIFVDHSEDYEIGEAIIEMNTFLEDTNENFNGGE